MVLSTGETNELHYQPGDHVAILPANRRDLVDAVIARLAQCPNTEEPIQVLMLKEKHTLNGKWKVIVMREWWWCENGMRMVVAVSN